MPRAWVAQAALGVFALAGSVSAHAQPFEGAITVRMGALGGGPTGGLQDVEFFTRGSRGVRVNAMSPMGAVSMLSMPAEQKVYVLLPAQNAYMEMPAGAEAAVVAAVDSLAPKVTRTGKKETIAGYACEHLTIATKRDTSDVCMAKGLGPFLNVLGGLRMGGARIPAWQRTLAAEGGFPLKVVGGDGKVALEVTKIEKRRLPAAMFVIPANYIKMDVPVGRPPGA